MVAQGGELDTDAAGNSTSVRSHLDSFGEFKPRSYDLVLERSDSAPGTHWRPLMGLGAATYLHWPALVSPVHYLSDIRQCLNWAAYHSNSFQDNDLLLRFAHHNETLFQNALYWLGTWFVDAVFLSKLVAVVGYGLGALLFFYIGKAAFGLRGGFLTAIFWTFFPDSWDYFIGGFSKMWMIPMLGLAVYLIDQKKWRIYAVAMPISAILYPVIPVHMGLTLAIHAAFALFRREPDRRPMILNLVLGSVAAILALATKYVSPPDFIGGLTPGSVLEKMPEMYRGGLNTYLPVSPVHEDILSYIDHPFTVIASIVYLVLLGRNIVWHRSWTSLAVASIIGYVIADFLFMQLYVPNRYTRNTALVLLALWNGGNSDALAGRIPWRPLRYLVLAALFAVAGFAFQDTLEMGKWTMDRSSYAPLSRFLGSLPEKILVAGHPRYMDDVPIQARRSVLVNYKMAHPWYEKYYEEIRDHKQATFRALYATDAADVNVLHERYGVTHLVVVRRHFNRARIKRGVYRNPYNDWVRLLVPNRDRFLFQRPPSSPNVVYRDDWLYVIELPLHGNTATPAEGE